MMIQTRTYKIEEPITFTEDFTVMRIAGSDELSISNGVKTVRASIKKPHDKDDEIKAPDSTGGD